MSIVLTVIQVVVAIVGLLIALISIPIFFPFRWPNPAMWGLKVIASALSSVFVALGFAILIFGFATDSLFIGLVGTYLVVVYMLHFISVTRPPAGEFENAFGINWETDIKPEQKRYFLSRRTVLKLPSVPEARLEQNIPFATIPGSDRKLLCDIWQPHSSIFPSGIAFIYMHGSAFYFLDKDFKTRPFFKHLAARGHVIMDVAHRLAPETDLMGMIQDVKRAIAWMKKNANKFGVDPDQIILGGGSSGGFLALMAGYTVNDQLFTPVELEAEDMGVSAVVAEYPATDLEALYYHTNQHLTTRPGKPKKKVPTKMPAWIRKGMGEDFHRLGMDKGFENAGTMAPLMGGHPDECPGRYRFFSPITHVSSNCPPTLLIHGTHDIMAPVRPARLLYEKLSAEKIPVIMHTLPQTDHGFDLVWPVIAPAAHNAFYDIERFIAIIARLKKVETRLTFKQEEISI